MADGGYQLGLTFSAIGDLGPLSTTIGINGPAGITLDDIGLRPVWFLISAPWTAAVAMTPSP